MTHRSSAAQPIGNRESDPAIDTLLWESDGPPFEVINQLGVGPVVLVCEHASNRIPTKLGSLGLSSAQLQTHIAWDPGALALAELLSFTFDAPLVASRFSRLVHDCNRPAEAPSAMPARTEVCEIPGNLTISVVERAARAREIYAPFHRELSRVLAAKRSQGAEPVLVTIHSFTPVFYGRQRFVEIGYLHGKDRRLAKAMLAHTNSDLILDIRLNEPYGPEDGVLHSIERHIDPSLAPHVMIEVRNDLLTTEQGLKEIHAVLSAALTQSLADLRLPPIVRMDTNNAA